VNLEERFEKWFQEEFVPSYAYSGIDPNTLRSVAQHCWDAGYEIAQEECTEGMRFND